MKYDKFVPIISWLAVIAWMTVIFSFSAQPAEISSETSGLPAKILAKIIKPDFDAYSPEYQTLLLDRCQFIVRKSAHFSVYTILGILTYIAFTSFRKPSSKMKFLLSAVICLLYAGGDELHQFFVPGRSCKLTDILIDFSGSLFGIFFCTLIIVNLLKKRKRKKKKNTL